MYLKNKLKIATEKSFHNAYKHTIFLRKHKITNQQYNDQIYKLKVEITKNSLEATSYSDEVSVVNELVKNKIISTEEGNEWKSYLNRNISLLNQDSKDIKSKILKNLDELNEMRNNRKNK